MTGAATMRAARYATGGPDAGRLEVVDLPRPDPAPGEVLVRVAVAGVNPTDWKSRRTGGTTAGFDAVVPGQDGAGVVDAVGEGVDPGRVGERVWLWEGQWQRAQGTAAQWIALPARQAVPLPADASLDLGAGLGIPAMTAHRCLWADGSPAGRTVLVHGGAGAVGHAAIELARHAGARVAATVSNEEKGRLAREAGADLVVDYRREDVAAAVLEWSPAGVDRIVDVDVVANLEVNARVVASDGAIVGYAVGREPVALGRELMVRNAVLRFVLVYTMPDEAKEAAVAAITRALEQGALTALPATRFPLSEVAEAHDAVEAGAVGKVLLDLPSSETG
jgi:NADPH2:quinone reductase